MKYGAQFYSFKKYLKDEDGYRDAFSRVKGMGAEVVQFSGALPVDSKILGNISREFELPVCITHAPFKRVKEDIEALAEEHADFGCKNMGVGMMPGEYRTGKLGDLDAFIEILNNTAEKLKGFGMTISYHNHWFEFDKVEGRVMMDYMVENTRDVLFIPDTFWIKVGGQDPAAYIEKLSGRINTVHLKDYSRVLGVPVFRAVGRGKLDMRGIISAAERAGAQNAVVELDYSPRPYESMAYSLAHLKKLNNE